MNQYKLFFVQTSTRLPNMYQKLIKHGKCCKQNNQLPIKSHDELEDNSNILKWFWPSVNRYRMFFVQTSTRLPNMYQKLITHGDFCKQNNQLPTKSHDVLEDNLNILKTYLTPELLSMVFSLWHVADQPWPEGLLIVEQTQHWTENDNCRRLRNGLMSRDECIC